MTKEEDENIIAHCPSTEDVSSNDNAENEVTLSIAQKAWMEVNRQKALLVRQEKLNKRKLLESKKDDEGSPHKILRIENTTMLDTGAGFFVEETPERLTEDDISAAQLIASQPPPMLLDEQPDCNDCGKSFNNSYLYHNFEELVCDNCRDKEEKHSLITKTDAKKNYLLKDGDFDRRSPPLKFIVKKNPHNSRWGDMKLYLQLQVEKRALEVWGTEEKLEEALENLDEKRELGKKKKFMKKMKELRMNVRSSLYTRASSNHQHEYGEEQYLPDQDEYSKTCLTCGHSYTYDKM